MDAAEEYVRSKWDRIATGEVALHLSDYSSPIVITHAGEFSNWQAAYEFTLAHEEKIQQVREEIALLRRLDNEQDLNATEQVTMSGIVAFIQAHLDSILVGWKRK